MNGSTRTGRWRGRRTAPALAAAALLAALAAGACGEGGTGPAAGATLSAAEASDLAASMDGTGNQVVGTQTGQLDVSSATPPVTASGSVGSLSPDLLSASTTFHAQRDCRLGGTVTVDGQVDHSFDTGTGTLTADFRATVTHDGCVLPVRGHRITVTGDPNLRLQAHRQRVNGLPSGLQTLSLTGTFTWEKADGTGGSCQVDLQGQLDPDAHTRTIDGTFCGHEVHESLTWDGTGG